MEIRTFIAVELNEEMKSRVSDLQRELKRYNANVKWIKPESIHVTLKFLGDMNVSRIPSIADAVTNAVKGEKVFTLSLQGTGVFPRRSSPRVLWAGIGSGSEILIRLANRIDEELSLLNIAREKRPFSPHITFGRVRPSSATGEIRNVVDMLYSQSITGASSKIDQVVLMKSDLQPSGAVYTALHRIKLEG